MTGAIVGVFVAGLIAFALSVMQARINARHGTDHAVHEFLINRIRERRGKLFVRIPNLLNEAYIGALPLYLHWIFAKFPLRVMRAAEILLNPTVNFLHTIVVGLLGVTVAEEMGGSPWLATAIATLFALTPQFYHALSARNFGLSARSIGLILLTGSFYFAFRAGQAPSEIANWVLLALACYLVIAFSTFGAQALVLMSLALVVQGQPEILLGALLGLLAFLAVHPRYSWGYLTNTVRFIAAYARELAPRYVLARRYSVWRDLVRDIVVKTRREGLTAGARYAYENSVIIVVVLSPLTVLATWAAIVSLLPPGTLSAFAAKVAAASLAAMVLTSFRATRFLGEPERYVEAGAAFAVLAGGAALYRLGGAWAPWAANGVFAGLCALQVAASLMLARYLSAKPLNLDSAREAIAAAGHEVRCASNNEQYLKLMLPNDWRFSYCIAVGHGYCGMPIDEVFDPFPYPRREALQTIVATYRITHCILDRTRFDELYDSEPDELLAQRVIFESEGIRVLRFDWCDGTRAKAA